MTTQAGGSLSICPAAARDAAMRCCADRSGLKFLGNGQASTFRLRADEDVNGALVQSRRRERLKNKQNKKKREAEERIDDVALGK